MDTSGEKFENSPELKRWATIENLKIAAASYNEVGSIAELERKISVQTQAGKSAKQSVVELEHRIKDLGEIIKYAEQYRANRSYHIGYDPASDRFMVSMPLIAQLGKNFNTNLPMKMAGADLLEMALDRVLGVEHLIGGKTVYIECNNHPKLFDFYSATGFFPFDERVHQTNDPNDTNNVLVQMLKYFNH